MIAAQENRKTGKDARFCATRWVCAEDGVAICGGVPLCTGRDATRARVGDDYDERDGCHGDGCRHSWEQGEIALESEPKSHGLAGMPKRCATRAGQRRNTARVLCNFCESSLMQPRDALSCTVHQPAAPVCGKTLQIIIRSRISPSPPQTWGTDHDPHVLTSAPHARQHKDGKEWPIHLPRCLRGEKTSESEMDRDKEFEHKILKSPSKSSSSAGGGASKQGDAAMAWNPPDRMGSFSDSVRIKAQNEFWAIPKDEIIGPDPRQDTTAHHSTPDAQSLQSFRSLRPDPRKTHARQSASLLGRGLLGRFTRVTGGGSGLQSRA